MLGNEQGAIAIIEWDQSRRNDEDRFDKINGELRFNTDQFNVAARNAGLAALSYGIIGVLCFLCWAYSAFIRRPQ